MMAYHNDDVYEKERVDGNVVVTLKESIVIDSVKGVYSDGNEILNICLDSEEYIADFEGEGRNRSLGIEHFGPKDSLYLWLYGKKIGDQVSYNGKRYGIVGIVDRYFFITRYVFSKIIGSNGKSKIPVKTIRTDDLESMKNELISFFESEDNLRARAGRKKLMDMYHHRGYEMGIPIESLNSCDYTEYIEIVRDLLYVPNQALYAGESTNYYGIQNFVLTLPSLTIICLLSLEGLYDVIGDRLIIPESLKSFIQNQINNNSNTQKISPGRLITTEAGDMMMLENDVDVIDIWRRMYEFCDGIRTVEVSDKERSEFKFIADTDAEKFFNKMNYDMCQLDAFIVAKEKTAVMIMDDLFFRKLAEYSAIHTTNSAFVLYLSDTDEVYEKAARLSETNYILTPRRYKDVETGKRFWENLLKGEIKRVVYGQQLSLIYEQINRINEAYGNGNNTGIATVVETMD